MPQGASERGVIMQTQNETREIVIPFSGFYESLHDSEIDETINRMFSDDNGNENNGLSRRIYDACNFRDVHTAYAKEYAARFAGEFELPSLTFKELVSPREYNFTTDRIFCTIENADIEKMRDETTPLSLEAKARDMFTSCDGFISFYDPDYKTWGDITEWDHNQLACLLSAY